MRLIFDRNLKFRGYSESLENVTKGFLQFWGENILFLIIFFAAPLETFWLAKNFKKAGKKYWKNRFNPLHNPIPFIIINAMWMFLVGWMIFGKAFKKPSNPNKPATFWDFKDPKHHNPVADRRSYDNFTYKINE